MPSSTSASALVAAAARPARSFAVSTTPLTIETTRNTSTIAQVTSDRAGCLGVAKRLLHQLREPPPGAVELGVEARVLSRKFPERIKAGNCLYDVPQQDEEGIGIAGVFGGQPLGAVHVLPEQCGGEATTIGKVPIEGRLADARSSSDLVQGDVGAVGEEFTRGSQYRLTIALSILAPLGLPSGSHRREFSTG